MYKISAVRDPLAVVPRGSTRPSGFAQGFDLYDDRVDEREINQPNYERTATNTLRAILEWLATDPPEPFFLFTNFIDPHGPYRPPERHRSLYASGKQRTLPLEKIPAYQRLAGELNYRGTGS